MTPREVAADAFASEFLMPRWLVSAHVRRQGWSRQELTTPSVVYQLSLRLGVSYQAMCWALAGHQAISRDEARRLAEIPPKTTKQATMCGCFLDNPWANVWSLTQRDSGLTFFGTPDDIILIELQERASAGLSWNVETATKQGFKIVNDVQSNQNEIGGFGVRRFAIRGTGKGHLHISERRQWDPGSKPRTTFAINYCLEGKESGFPRVYREAH